MNNCHRVLSEYIGMETEHGIIIHAYTMLSRHNDMFVVDNYNDSGKSRKLRREELFPSNHKYRGFNGE